MPHAYPWRVKIKFVIFMPISYISLFFPLYHHFKNIFKTLIVSNCFLSIVESPAIELTFLYEN